MIKSNTEVHVTTECLISIGKYQGGCKKTTMHATTEQLIQTIKQLTRTAKQHMLFYLFFSGLLGCLVVGLFLC